MKMHDEDFPNPPPLREEAPPLLPIGLDTWERCNLAATQFLKQLDVKLQRFILEPLDDITVSKINYVIKEAFLEEYRRTAWVEGFPDGRILPHPGVELRSITCSREPGVGLQFRFQTAFYPSARYRAYPPAYMPLGYYEQYDLYVHRSTPPEPTIPTTTFVAQGSDDPADCLQEIVVNGHAPTHPVFKEAYLRAQQLHLIF